LLTLIDFVYGYFEPTWAYFSAAFCFPVSAWRHYELEADAWWKCSRRKEFERQMLTADVFSCTTSCVKTSQVYVSLNVTCRVLVFLLIVIITWYADREHILCIGQLAIQSWSYCFNVNLVLVWFCFIMFFGRIYSVFKILSVFCFHLLRSGI